SCRREAPDVEQFARDHLQELEVIGLGTQDSLGQAEDFVEDYGTESFTMLWDESFLSWQALGVTSQPAAVMFAADGTPITGWIGAFPEDEVLRLAAESQAT
ncbi:TlpA family protein disulfide reductase, partial [Ilumatobacter sp.]|uniref:TlpA family protein disulfide reductase n=1 Tax=Ilumatobacter sp. TaxID=1967498 RepID=UPI00375304D1